MRDFRDAKAMARTLRAALAAKGLKITVSQSLELIAEAFGAADWNTLAAAIRREALNPRARAASPASGRQTAEAAPVLFSAELESTLDRALAYASQRTHEYTTLEHLLLALIDDVVASAVMKACKVDAAALKTKLTNYIDNELKTLAIDDGLDSRPTPAFQRVVQRAMLQVKDLGRETATGGDLLVAMFDERERAPPYGFSVSRR